MLGYPPPPGAPVSPDLPIPRVWVCEGWRDGGLYNP